MKSRKLVKADRTEMYLWDGKLHNMKGPALIPEGNNRKREYYINGIKYSEKDWKDIIKNKIEDINIISSILNQIN